MQGLSIHLLGRPRIELDGETLSSRIPVKGQAMVFYVAALGRPQPRAAIAALLWGGLGESAARANLRLVLSRLRRVLGSALDLADGAIGLSATAASHVDLHALQTVAERLDEAPLDELEQAAAHIAGEFLEGFDIDDATSFGDWVESERLSARRAACRLWSRIAALREAGGNLDGAIDAGRQLLRLEPWDEAVQEAQMRRLARSGRPLAAVAQYEMLRRTLAEELGARPGPRIEALYRTIRTSDVHATDDQAVAAVDAPAQHPNASPAVAPRTPAAAGGSILHPPPSAARQPTAAAGALLGRDDDLMAIERRLVDPDCRALVLLGPGGIGKTWLARAAATRVSTRFRDGSVFVALADQPARNAAEAEERVVGAIAHALGLALPGPHPTRQTLPEALAELNLLLVLDNVEIAQAAAPWLGAMLQRASQLKCLLTSRQRLALPEAWLLDVQGLPQAAAVALFERCARRVRSDFDAVAQADAIRRICLLVGGSPLAIELAAQRAHALSCSDIADRLTHSIDLLGNDAGASRHRSLRAVFDDSWAAMGSKLQDAACRLAVFDGAFDVEAARAVADAGVLELTALAGNCWLVRAAAAGGRFAMHPLVRHYTRERAAENEPRCARLGELHARHYLERFASHAGALSREPAPAILSRADADVDELRSAIAWTQRHGATPMLVELLDAAWPYLQRKGWIDEFAAAIAQAFARGDIDPQVRARWRSRLGHGRFIEGRPVEAAEDGTRALREHGEPISRTDAGWYLHTMTARLRYARERRRLGAVAFESKARHVIDSFCYVGQLAYFEGEAHKSLAMCLRGLALLRHAGPCAESACVAGVAAYMAGLFGLDSLSRRLAVRALALERESNSPLARAHALNMASLCRLIRGEWAGTDEAIAEAIELYRALGQPRWLMESSSIRGKALYLQGRLAEARRAFERMDTEARQTGNVLGRHWATLGLVECGLRSAEMPATQALALLADVRRFAAVIEVSDPAEIIRQQGLSALFHLRAGDRPAARNSVALAAALIGRTRLCGFWALEGYSCAIETALRLADEDPAALSLAGTLSRRFDRLARYYPILRPRAAWAAASVAAACDGEGAARDRFGRASRLADRWHVGLDRMLLEHA